MSQIKLSLSALLCSFAFVACMGDPTGLNNEDVGGTGGSAPTCNAGNEGCGCYGNGTCNGSLVCTGGICTTPTGTGGATATGGSTGTGGATPSSTGGATVTSTGGTTPSATGGAMGTGGASVPSSTGGATGGLVEVEFIYTLPAGRPEPKQVLVKGWIPGYQPDFADFCNSANPSTNRFNRTGDTFRCTRLLPSNWRSGDYAVAVDVGNENIHLVPSKTAQQHHCYEQQGSDRPAGCTTNCFALYGTFTVRGVDMSLTCAHPNGLTVGGCNVTPAQCGG